MQLGTAEGDDRKSDRLRAAKKLRRTELLAARDRRPEAERHASTQALAAHVARIVAEHGWSRVAAYQPFGAEPGSPATWDTLRDNGIEVVLPRIQGTDLDWASHDGALTPGWRGILEPAGPSLGVAALSGVDTVFAPALAVDQHGVRLGYGRGYYDRALAHVAAGRPIIAIVYDDEVVDELPYGPYDHAVTHTLTPGTGLRELTTPRSG